MGNKRFRSVFIGIFIGILIGLVFIHSGIQLGRMFYLHLLLLFFFFYLNIYIHEFGHALFGRLLGIGIRRVIIGTGRELFSIKIMGIIFVVTSNFNGGFTIPYEYGSKHFKLRFSLFTLGGMVVQSFAVALSVLIWGWHPLTFFTAQEINIQSAFVVAGLTSITLSVIPFNVVFYGIRMPNDGLSLLMTPFIKKRRLEELLSSSITNDGFGFMKNKEYAYAEQRFREAISKYPQQPLAHINLGAVLMKQIRIDEAIDVLEQLRTMSIDKKYEPLLSNTLAWAYLLKYDDTALKKADKFSEVSFKKYPEISFFRGTRGCVLIALGRVEEGLAILQNQVKVGKRIDDEVNTPIGFIFVSYGYLILGKRDKAGKFIKYLREYKYRGSWDPDYKHLFEIIKRKTNNYDGLISPDDKLGE